MSLGPAFTKKQLRLVTKKQEVREPVSSKHYLKEMRVTDGQIVSTSGLIYSQ